MLSPRVETRLFADDFALLIDDRSNQMDPKEEMRGGHHESANDRRRVEVSKPLALLGHRWTKVVCANASLECEVQNSLKKSENLYDSPMIVVVDVSPKAASQAPLITPLLIRTHPTIFRVGRSPLDQ